jgi:hypothetical protein
VSKQASIAKDIKGDLNAKPKPVMHLTVNDESELPSRFSSVG